MILPKTVSKVKVPPIKCQGIKTKLINFIFNNIEWDGKGKYFEPFLGSGVVLFNLNPKKAIVSDINPHIISFYKKIQTREITPSKVRDFLQKEGYLLRKRGEKHYYEIRERFNSFQDPLDLLFLNRSCFNGLMRFNNKGGFNVPFCKKDNRFRKAYITKIVNQVKWVSKTVYDKDWQFICADWNDILKLCEEKDFIYLDPPYYGRHTNYIGYFTEEDIINLMNAMHSLSSGYALSFWHSNKYRVNPMIEKYLKEDIMCIHEHEYFVGPKETNRHKIKEALMIKPTHISTKMPGNNK